jgi:serine/threonine protein kinase
MPSEFLNALKEGQALQEYQIVRVLGTGGFGITYLAFDENLDKAVAIKEFLPNDLALRLGDCEVKPKSTEAQADFKWGLEQFLREAKILAKFNHPNIIRINRFFEANGTGYIVMDYAEGQTLTAKVKEVGTLSEEQLKPLLLSISDGLKQAHGFGILHRDIKPGNIMILEDGTPILIDFGSARQAIEVKSKSVTSIITPGYAPIEQYDTNGKQGPWTDIYALGAVAFAALVGERPPDATGRIRVDNMTPVVDQKKNEMSQSFLEAIDWALNPQEECRPQNIDDWKRALTGEDVSKVKKNIVNTKPNPAFNIEDEKTVINKSSSKGKKKSQPIDIAQDVTYSEAASRKKSLTPYFVGVIVIIAALLISAPYIANLLKQVEEADNEQVEEALAIEGVANQAPDAVEVDAQEVEAVELDTVELDTQEVDISDEEAWLSALSINTIESFLGYISAFPVGRYVDDANGNLKALSIHNNMASQLFAISQVNIRLWPSTSAPMVGALSLGQRVGVVGKLVERNWYSLKGNGSEFGYVHADLLRQEELLFNVIASEEERGKIKQGWRDAIQQHNR